MRGMAAEDLAVGLFRVAQSTLLVGRFCLLEEAFDHCHRGSLPEMNPLVASIVSDRERSWKRSYGVLAKTSQQMEFMMKLVKSRGVLTGWTMRDIVANRQK